MMSNIADIAEQQVRQRIREIIPEKAEEIVQAVRARWNDRVNRRVIEANWAVEQGRTYDPEHALLKMYDAYRWVADHVHLDVDTAISDDGAQITLRAAADDDSVIDDYRSERIAECVGDLMQQINYSYF